MVTPLEVELIESQPGEFEVEDSVLVTYRILSIKAAKVGNGYSMSSAIDVVTRFRQQQRVIGICGAGNAPYRSASFKLVKMAHATVKVEGKVFEVFTEPVAVMIADGYITPLGEPCIALYTATGWSVK